MTIMSRIAFFLFEGSQRKEVYVYYTKERLPDIEFCGNERCMLLKEMENNLRLADTNRSLKSLSRGRHEKGIMNWYLLAAG